jgi:glycosyltransferase involved in cell wall biosynthesis
MKIAHAAIATPGKCGLYETTRELVAAERNLGVDARIVDPKPVPGLHPGDNDRGAKLDSMDWAITADVIVSHSGHDGTPVADTDQPIIHAIHGRPLSTFLMERDGKAPAYSYYVNRSKRDRYVGAVTFWPEYEPYLRMLWSPKPVHVIQPTVDLASWSPRRTDYDFGGKKGAYNVVMADPWARLDVSPFHAINAFALFKDAVPDAKLHIYAADKNTKGFDALFSVLGDSLGLVQGWAADLATVYRAADMLITPHRIYTRSIREAMACGCEVVSGMDHHPEDIEGFALEMARRATQPRNTRGLAVAMFDPIKAARQMLAVIDELAGVPVGD